LQCESRPTRLNAKDVHFRAMLSIEELQSSKQPQPMQGMPLTGLRKILATAVVEGSRRLTSVHRVNNEHLGTSLKEWDRTEKISLGGQD
jgi:hypothetical protein